MHGLDLLPRLVPPPGPASTGRTGPAPPRPTLRLIGAVLPGPARDTARPEPTETEVTP